MHTPGNRNKSNSYRLLENISYGFLVLDNENIIQYANTAAKRIFISTDAYIGKELWGHLPEGLRGTFQQEITKAQLLNQELHFEAISQAITPIWISVNLFPNKSGVSVLFRDITSQKEVEYNIQEKHTKLILLAGAANHIIFNEEPKKILDSLFNELSDYLDLDVYFNYSYDKERNKLRLLNYSGVNEEIAKEIEWLELGEAVCGCAAQKRSRIVVEDVQESTDSSVNWLKGLGIRSYACHPLISYGELIGTLSLGSSKRSTFSSIELELMETICSQVAMALERTFLITELKHKNTELTKNYRQLLESEKKFRDIFNGALDGIVLINKDGLIIDANPSACKKLRVKLENCISKKIHDIFKHIKLAKTTREAAIQLNDGTEKIIEYSVAKEITPGNHLIIFRDVTSKKKVAKALIDAKEQAEKANKAKSEFLSMMSHELRTPLNSILGFSQIMLDDSNNLLNDIQRERVIRILKSGRHLINLINEILDHSQIESRKVSLKSETIHLQVVVEETIRLLHPIAEAKGVTIENNIDHANPLYVQGDVTRIKQVFINLLTNAIKYNKTDGQVILRYQLHQDHITLFIDDTGIGIPKDKLRQIFDPFYRIYHPYHNFEGTGIGLTLVKNFVSMMGGTVGVKSKYNQGSSFWFTLPLSNRNGMGDHTVNLIDNRPE